MENIRLSNLIKKYTLEYLTNLSYQELKSINGMTKAALKEIVVKSNNVELLKEYIKNN